MFTIVKFTLFSFVNMKNRSLKNMFSKHLYEKVKFHQITGRYVTNSHLDLVKKEFAEDFIIEETGRSVQDKPIYLFKLGAGRKKVLLWSQMHGNESTTTKAIFDMLNAFKTDKTNDGLQEIDKSCSLYIIPILNPDGAEAYTRVNANSKDLNRDLQELSQPESRVLMDLYKKIKPDFCLNLHDQRTIFSAGNNPNPATLSFLTPSKDPERSIDDSRKTSMSLITAMVKDLSPELDGQIGRYDDAFNINCAGDTFQHLSTPTILFEAGHYRDDYEREKVREFVFRALLSCLFHISEDNISLENYREYFDIPENQKLFNDIIIRNAELEEGVKDIGVQFREKLKNGRIEFEPVIEEIASGISKSGHREIDAAGKKISLPGKGSFTENVIVNKIILNTAEIRLKY